MTSSVWSGRRTFVDDWRVSISRSGKAIQGNHGCVVPVEIAFEEQPRGIVPGWLLKLCEFFVVAGHMVFSVIFNRSARC